MTRKVLAKVIQISMLKDICLLIHEVPQYLQKSFLRVTQQRGVRILVLYYWLDNFLLQRLSFGAHNVIFIVEVLFLYQVTILLINDFLLSAFITRQVVLDFIKTLRSFLELPLPSQKPHKCHTERIIVKGQPVSQQVRQGEALALVEVEEYCGEVTAVEGAVDVILIK